jgi:hypothetical protein
LLGGFVLNAVVTMAFHPSGDEDDHEAIFTEYADSGGWVAIHLGQFAGVLIVLAGFLVLTARCAPRRLICRCSLRPPPSRPRPPGPFCRPWTGSP